MSSHAQPAKSSGPSSKREAVTKQPTAQTDARADAADLVPDVNAAGYNSPAQVLQLQRMLGNRATQRVLQRQSVPKNTIQRLTYDDGDWASAIAVNMAASVNPVFFLSNIGGQSVVVKALSEAPQRAMFAQGIMEDVAELKTAKTRILDPNSSEATSQLYPKIAALLKPQREQLTQLQLDLANATEENKQSLTDQERTLRPNLERMERGLEDLKKARSIMVMESLTVASFSELGTDKTNRKLGADQDDKYYEKLFTNAQMWNSLGRIFVVDQFLGNEDRLETFKIQNVFINPAGELVALDNDAIMQQYVNEYTITSMGKKKQQTLSSQNYIQNAVGGGFMYEYSETKSENIQERPSANVELIAGDLDAQIAVQFRAFVGRFSTDKLLGHIFRSKTFTDVQDTMQAAMTTGAKETRAKLLKMMSDGSMKRRYQQVEDQYSDTYGEDQLFDYQALEMRGSYVNARENLDQQQALKQLSNDFSLGTAGIENLTNTLINETPQFTREYIDPTAANQDLRQQLEFTIELIRQRNIQQKDTAPYRQRFVTRAQMNRVALLRSLMVGLAKEFKKKDLNQEANNFEQLTYMAGILYAAIPSRGVFGEKVKLERRRKVGAIQTSIRNMEQAVENVT